jgi:hypothetical protein
MPTKLDQDQISGLPDDLNSLESFISIEDSAGDSADASQDIKLGKVTTKTFGVVIDGGGSDITTGIKGDVVIPYDMTITSWTLLGNQDGNIVISLWKSTYENFPPDLTGSITGSQKPTLGSSDKAQSTSLSEWTTSITAGDIIRFSVDSCSGITRATLTIHGTI